MIKLDKEGFLGTELGRKLIECLVELDMSLYNRSKFPSCTTIYEIATQKIELCMAQWEIYKIAIKQFFGIEYQFTRTEEYFGAVTEDESDWLLKISH
ncbi:MAG: hypothetical protein K2N34_15460 [Lachnospiraceae bacterium]|nr:hypothetical protein [Lachnospiraceae bacterium]